MLKYKSILFITLIAILHSCGGKKSSIIETDLSLRIPDTVNGETIAQSKKRNKIHMEELKLNTVNRYIPNIPVYDLSRQKLNLQDVISKKTIIVSSDSHCGFGKVSLLNDFPIALDSLKDELQDYEIICLIKRTKRDIEDNSRFDMFVSELQEIYEPLNIIEESDANRMNLLGNPTRFYINKDQKVEHIASGASNVENRIFEIRQNTGANTR